MIEALANAIVKPAGKHACSTPTIPGIQAHIEHLFAILHNGSGADLQLKALREGGSVRSAVSALSSVFSN